jgi:cytochrome P450
MATDTGPVTGDATPSLAGYDHWDPAFANDPYPEWKRLRETCPVGRSDAHGGFWVVSRYAEVADVCHRPEVFSSRYLAIPADIGAGDMPLPPINVDPPEHARFRRLLLPAFAPNRVADLEPAVRQIVDDLLDAGRSAEVFDLAEGLAKPLPVKVTERLLGTPPEDAERFARWVHALVAGGVADYEGSAAAVAEMAGYLGALLAERTEHPGDDIISLVAHLEAEEGPPFDVTERLGCVFLLLIAGIDTTWSALGTSLWHLARTPSDWQRLREDPALVPTAVEELLRAFAPTTVARVVKADTEVGGHTLREGEMVLVPFPSANRDAAEFPDPEDVVLDRQQNRHVAFGVGVHRCLGAGLARMEMRVALEGLLARAEALELVDEAAIRWKTGPIRGPEAVPARVRWA